MGAAEFRQHRIGLALVAAAALAWSSAGLFVRSIETDLMTMLFWRGLISGSTVMAVFFLIEGRKAFEMLKALRWPAVAVAVLSASAMISGIGSMRFTSIADAMVIYAMVPFITAGLAYLFIGEKPSRSTLIASAVALGGVGIMLWGAETGGSTFGRLLAVVMATSMAGFTTVMRFNRDVAMLPAMGASAWLCASVCWFFAEPLGVSGQDLLLIAMFGIIQNATGLVLYTLGSRLIPAAEATLIAALEVPLTPFWVWLMFAETPAPQTLIGGMVVLTALFAHIGAELRRRPDAAPQPFAANP
ncbi:MAG: DMT family transporter [Aestuariivirga sp.]